MGFGGANGGLDRCQLGAGSDYCCVGRVKARLLLVEQLLAGELALEDFAYALELLAGQQQFTLAQLHAGLGGGVVFPGAQHFGFGLAALGFHGACVDACQ
ncbi:hypothetical protein D3C75_884270 [compost metagenome]